MVGILYHILGNYLDGLATGIEHGYGSAKDLADYLYPFWKSGTVPVPGTPAFENLERLTDRFIQSLDTPGGKMGELAYGLINIDKVLAAQVVFGAYGAFFSRQGDTL